MTKFLVVIYVILILITAVNYAIGETLRAIFWLLVVYLFGNLPAK